MKMTERYLLLVIVVCGLTSCAFDGPRKSDQAEKPNKYEYAIIRYDIYNVGRWAAYGIGSTRPDQFRPLYHKMREITTTDTVIITNIENIINKQHSKLTAGDSFDTWMMVMLHANEDGIIDTLAICNEHGWFNGAVFRETELLGLVGNKIFEHDTEWKRKVIAERFYVDGKWRNHHEVFWEILTDDFPDSINIEMSAQHH